MSMMHETKNSLPEKTRAEVIRKLQDLLAHGIDFSLQTKQAHWNVRGTNFIALHKLFDKVNKHSREWVDLMAERIAQLGGYPEGTIQSVSARSGLMKYPLTLTDELQHVDVLSTSLANFGEMIRTAIDTTDESGDRDTADILTQISRGADQDLWMVEAHLDKPSAEGQIGQVA
jgi:starvation-inducible DNA-binding protein